MHFLFEHGKSHLKPVIDKTWSNHINHETPTGSLHETEVKSSVKSSNHAKSIQIPNNPTYVHGWCHMFSTPFFRILCKRRLLQVRRRGCGDAQWRGGQWQISLRVGDGGGRCGAWDDDDDDSTMGWAKKSNLGGWKEDDMGWYGSKYIYIYIWNDMECTWIYQFSRFLDGGWRIFTIESIFGGLEHQTTLATIPIPYCNRLN